MKNKNYSKNIILKFLLKLMKEFTKNRKKLDISFDVYTYDISHKTKTILNYNKYPIYISNNTKQNHINLLYFSDGNETFHYAWIKDFNDLCTI